MKYAFGFLFGLVCAVGFDVAWVMLRDMTLFESATGFDTITKAVHLVSMSAIVFCIMILPLGSIIVLPFAAIFYFLSRRLSLTAASVVAAVASASLTLPLTGTLHHRLDDEGKSVFAFMLILLPQTVASGAVGGFAFSLMARRQAAE